MPGQPIVDLLAQTGLAGGVLGRVPEAVERLRRIRHDRTGDSAPPLAELCPSVRLGRPFLIRGIAAVRPLAEFIDVAEEAQLDHLRMQRHFPPAGLILDPLTIAGWVNREEVNAIFPANIGQP